MSNYHAYKLNIKILTPVIVGTERTLDSFEYVIGKNQKSNQREAYLIKLFSFLESLPKEDQKDLLASLEQSFIDFRKKIQNYKEQIIQNKKYYSESILATRPVVDKVNEASDANQLLVNLLPRSLHGPYLPGSSVKGALRTAFVSQANKNSKNEKEALGYKTTYDDPFRALKISDSLDKLPTYLVKVEVWNKKINNWMRLEKLTILKEAFRRSKGEDSFKASFLVTFDNRSLKKECSFKIALDKEIITKACREFYKKVYEHDENYFSSANNKLVIENSWVSELKASFNEEAQAFPLRIGWGCGAVSMKVNLFNSKKTIQRLRDNKKTWPTSRRLVVTGSGGNGDKFLPLGWAIGTWENV